jgi:hypothetical protein
MILPLTPFSKNHLSSDTVDTYQFQDLESLVHSL